MNEKIFGLTGDEVLLVQQTIDRVRTLTGHLPSTVSRRRTLPEQTTSGGIELGVIVSGPPGGFGPATWRKISIAADGSWSAVGDEMPVIVPRL